MKSSLNFALKKYVLLKRRVSSKNTKYSFINDTLKKQHIAQKIQF